MPLIILQPGVATMKNTEEIRAEIDKIDNAIVELYLQRMKAADAIAEAKKNTSAPVSNPERERNIIDRVTKMAGPELEDGAALLFTTLFGISKARQRHLISGPGKVEEEISKALEETEDLFPKHATVACQGTEGAYSQQAATNLFKYPTILYFNNFDDVFNAVEKGMCRYGILPIENSAAGSVTAVYDQMVRHNFRIVRASRLHVEHALLAPKGTKLEDIREVSSHPQALSQCSEFLKAHPAIKQVPAPNTAVAARELASAQNTSRAVIASRACAELYGLEIINDNINDTQANFTRFICISKELEIYPDSRKISIMMSLPHRPGTLGNVLAKFASVGVNLTKLESRPAPGRDFEFRFTFEFEARPNDSHAIRLLSELSQDPEIEHFTFLGAYAEN